MLDRVFLANSCLFAFIIGSSSASFAGPIFLTGHDPDFHAQGTNTEALGAQNLLRTGLDFVTGGTYNSGTEKFLWVESRISPPSGHRTGELGLGFIGLSLGTHYDRANGAELSSINFSDYSAIVTASSFGGLFSRAELDALISFSSDITDFVNNGGGIYSMANCFPCGQNLLAGNTAPDLFGFLPIDVVSVATSGPYDPTAYGTDVLGLVFNDLNSPTHNAFEDAAGLNVIDIDRSNGLPVTLAGDVRIGDGGFEPPTGVSETTPIAMLGLGLLGIGIAARRKNKT